MIKLIVLLFSPIFLFSQLKSDAGSNLYLCSTKDSFKLAPINSDRQNDFLGGSPTASGGVSPYKYKWECEIKTNLTSKPFIYASDIIEDTTSSNPKFKYKNGLIGAFTENKPIKFILTVTDSIGSIAKDSLIIMQSTFYFSGIKSIGKKAEDTIILPNVAGGGINPSFTIWSPTRFLIDTNKAGTRTYSNEEIIYSGYRLDSLGCMSENFNIQIYLFVSAINSSKAKKLILNYHNPINENSFFEFSKPNAVDKVEIYNIIGEKLYSENSSDRLELGRLTKEKGLYFIVLYNRNNEINTIKVERD